MSILIVLVACPSETGYYWAFYANRAECPSQVSKRNLFKPQESEF